MTTSDWVKVQAKDQVIHDLIQWYGTKELHKGKDMDSPEMKQFLWQRGKLIVRNEILYHKNDTKESECPNHNTMQLVLPTTLRLQAWKGCHDGDRENLRSLEKSILLAWNDRRCN